MQYTQSFTSNGSHNWVCPAGVTTVYVECFGGGASGCYPDGSSDPWSGAGGGGGAYAARIAVPVTPGNTYTFTVGKGGGSNLNEDAGNTTFTGDSSTLVIAEGGFRADPGAHGASGGTGGRASASTGDTGLKFSGGNGGDAPYFGSGALGGSGGGASGNQSANGANGSQYSGSSGGAGGTGANGGGSGGAGANYFSSHGHDGTNPGGGGGGVSSLARGTFNTGGGAHGKVILTWQEVVPYFLSTATFYAPTVFGTIPYFTSTATFYTPVVQDANVNVSYFVSTASFYAPIVQKAEIDPSYFLSTATFYHVFSIYKDTVGTGPGNGGESFLLQLAPNGTSETATLAANITSVTTLITLTSYGSLPATGQFCLTIDDEVMQVEPIGGGSFRIRHRGLSNTVAASHTAGATVTWTDTYDMAILATNQINSSFTANITGSGSYTYPGWLICFDSTQAYIGTDRYPMHVTEVVGVFDNGAGVSGTNRLDASQPHSIYTPLGISDDCPAALSNPARISSNILVGDVGIVRYTNPEASIMILGSRSTALQAWFGFKRVDPFDVDVTLTDPTGTVVDGSVQDTWLNPSSIGIGPDTGTPTPNNVPFTTVTLLGADRNFTVTSEKGWPIACLAVRQGKRRIPRWQSYDWHNYNYVTNGFVDDGTFCQMLINRNGVIFGSAPIINLPSAQDIDGPNAVWDDGSYYFAASWYVVIFSGPYIVVGPSIGGEAGAGTGGTGEGGSQSGGYLPGVEFPGGTPTIVVPSVEGGSGGDLDAPSQSGFFQASIV